MMSSHEPDNDPFISARLEDSLAGLRQEFRRTQAEAVDAAMQRVRREAELKSRMHALVREPKVLARWSAWRRRGLAAAACAAVVALAAIGFARLTPPSDPSAPTVAQSTPAAQSAPVAVASVREDRPLSVQIAEARPGETLMLAKATVIEASGEPLRLSKRLRIEVGAPSNN